MYARSPDPNKQSVKIPENYGGHAFRSSGMYNDMPPPARVEPLTERSPQQSDAGTDHDVDPYINEPDTAFEPYTDQAPQNIGLYAPPPARPPEPSPSPSPSIFSSLMPPSASASGHFPFGHGIGSEEILIIAMMLLVYLSDSDSADNELLLLLGLLLFAG